MVFASLTNKSPIGNTYIMDLDPDVAEILQKASWTTYKDFQKRIIDSGL